MSKLAIAVATATAMIAPHWGARIGLDSAAHAAMIVAQQSPSPSQVQSQELSQQDQDFARKAAVGNIFEVEAARLALERSGSGPVQDFARRMIEDHSTAQDQLVTLARQEDFTLSVELDQEHQQKLQELREASGEEFDQHYIEGQVEAHRQTIDLFARESEQGENAPLRDFARETLPTLRSHLDMARTIASDIGIDAAAVQDQQGQGQQAQSGAVEAERTEIAAEQAAQESTVQAPEPPEPPEPDVMVEQDEAAAQNQEGEAAEEEVAAVAAPEDREPAGAGTIPDNPLYLLTAEELVGRTVTGATGEEIGDIEDIVLGRDDQSLYAVVSVGGFLGIGGRDVAIPFERLVIGADDRLMLEGMTKEELASLPAYDQTGYDVVERDALLRESLRQGS